MFDAVAWGREYREKNRDALREKNRAYKRANRDKVNEGRRALYAVNIETERKRSRDGMRRLAQRRRQEALAAYGGKCECCGEEQEVFLDVDHIDGGGSAHRKEVGEGSNFYAWLDRSDYPPGFRILCRNCNWATWRLGACPHGSA